MKFPLLIATFLLFSFSIFSQNITNTLGTGGTYTVQDASNDFLTVTQSTGQVNLLNTLGLQNTTDSQTGVIYKGTDWFLHNFKPSSNVGYNTFIGINSGNFTMSSTIVYEASYNTGIGYNALNDLTTGWGNTAIGSYSQSLNENGSNNVSVGTNSLYGNEGYNNVAVGVEALRDNWTGYFNTALGCGAGLLVEDGYNLTLLGYDAQPTNSHATNEITLGNSDVASLRCNVTTITSLSDARDKNNIKDLTLGLDFITKLKPRLFNWDKREWYDDNKSDGSKMHELPTAGFIAQELDEVQTICNAEWLNLVYKSNPEKLEATPGNLLPVMVKAIQELKEENDKLKTELESFKSLSKDIARIKKVINEILSNEENPAQVIFNDIK